jgi:hypothetical protein
MASFGEREVLVCAMLAPTIVLCVCRVSAESVPSQCRPPNRGRIPGDSVHALPLPVNEEHASFAAFAVDGDLVNDVIATTSANTVADRVVWFRNEGGASPTWAKYSIRNSSGGYCDSVAVADVDGDGRLDVVTTDGMSATGNTVWYSNQPWSPSAWSAYTIAVGNGARLDAVAVTDMDGDGRVDVLRSASYSIVWYKNGGGVPPVWGPPQTLSPSASWSIQSLAVGDISGDGGAMDVVYGGSSAQGSLTWLKGSGGEVNGTLPSWAAATLSSATSIRSLQLTDVDGDGRLDVLAVAASSGQAMWYQNQGAGSGGRLLWGDWRPFNIASVAAVSSMHAVDLTGDGFVDLITVASGGGQVATYTSSALCEAGAYGAVGGSAPCLPCPPGRYSPTRGHDICTPCPGGRYGVGVGSVGLLADSTACPGTCPGGFACPSGTPSALAMAACPRGRYSLPAAGTCSPCPGGRYGAAIAQANITCSGGCGPGFACPPGATEPLICPPGRSSDPGAAVCTTLLPATNPPAMVEVVVSSASGPYRGLRVARIDDDERVDLVVFNLGAHRIEWCRNDGGTPLTWTNFTVAATIATALPFGLATADIG